MIFGFDANLGSSALTSLSTTTLDLGSFNKMVFYNKNYDMKLTQIYGNYIDVTEEYLENYDVSVIPVLKPETYLLATFNHIMAAGNIIGFDGSIDKWVLYRENSSTQQVEHITNLDGEIQKYIDYTGLKGQSYRYYIYAQSGSKMSNAFVTNYVDMDYYGYFLIDKTNERVYVFDTNVGDNAISKNMVYDTFEGNTKYATYAVGNMDYASGNISGLVRSPESIKNGDDVNNSIGLLQSLRNCIYDIHSVKYVKTRKGEIFRVFTYNYSESPLDQAIGAQPMIASFSWNEIDEV